jgi:hypothetical protein
MNNIRRKSIATIQAKLVELREELENIQNEEQEYHDNMPEGIQGSEKGEKADAAVNVLGDAISALEEISEYLDSAQE